MDKEGEFKLYFQLCSCILGGREKVLTDKEETILLHSSVSKKGAPQSGSINREEKHELTSAKGHDFCQD